MTDSAMPDPAMPDPAMPDPAMPDRAARLAALRARVRRLEGFAEAGDHGVLPIGLPALDAALPGGGLPLACLHDIAAQRAGAGDDGPATGFAALLAARLAAHAGDGPAGTVLWLTREDTLYPPGLSRFGLTPNRLIVARAVSQTDLLWSLEEAARSGAVAAVVGEAAAPGSIESRRLQLAAETGGATMLLLQTAGGEAGAAQPGTAATRWRVAAATSQPAPGGAGVGHERWQLDLVRCRGGRPGSWLVAWLGLGGGLTPAEPEPAGAAPGRVRAA
jgi:protein ImuA